MVAAVIGRRFEARVVASALKADEAADPPDVAGDLNTLEGHGVIKLVETRPELAYSFRHALSIFVVTTQIAPLICPLIRC